MSRAAKELMRAGELYPGDDPELNRELDERQVMLEELNSIPYARKDERRLGFERLLAAIGEDTFIRSPFYCDYGDGISIGSRTFINFNCTMLDGAPITIGDECLLAAGVQLITATHPIDPASRRGAIEQAAARGRCRRRLARGRSARLPRGHDRGEHRGRSRGGRHPRPSRRRRRPRQSGPGDPRDRRS